MAERRFAVAEYTRDEQTFGGKLAGKRPDVGELPLEEKYEVIERQQQEGEEDQDTARVDRHGARDVYLLTRSKTDKDKSGGGGWGLPEGTLKQGEGLHEVSSETPIWFDDCYGRKFWLTEIARFALCFYLFVCLFLWRLSSFITHLPFLVSLLSVSFFLVPLSLFPS